MVRKRVLGSFKPVGFRPPRGRKEVWLPNWSITLLRTPWLPLHMACFKVPLNINKLDMKDYLYNAYGIPALQVRSWIKQPPRQQKFQGRKWYRPRSLKRMIVEMDDSHRGGPFVWPEEIAQFEPWDKEQYDSARESRREDRNQTERYGNILPRKPGALLNQIGALRKGQDAWKPSWTETGAHTGQHSGVGAPQELRRL